MLNENNGLKIMSENRNVLSEVKIIGLHGYKNIEIDFDELNPSILIAENGSGKTAVMSIIVDVLSLNIFKLKNTPFKSIQISFHNQKYKKIFLDKNHINNFIDIFKQKVPNQIRKILDMSNISYDSFFSFINSYVPERFVEYKDSEVVTNLYRETPFDYDAIERVLKESFNILNIELLIKDKKSKIINVEWIKTVFQIRKDYQIIYFPTYRRVEIPKRKGSIRYNEENTIINNNDDGRIYFGVEDVENRLFTISQEIENKTNLAYREISLDIINDLSTSNFESQLQNIDLCEQFNAKRLENFISRLKKQHSNILNSSLPSIDDNPNQFLKYFLNKLTSVEVELRQIEDNIQAYINAVNEFLNQSGDSKSLIFNYITLKVTVIDKFINKEIPFSSLSSGEKQIIAIFAKLYLYDKPKIVFFDEPEISLSIDWQKKLLPSFSNSFSCHQLVVMTHSPFIFDNNLDQFATDLQIKKVKNTNVIN